MRRDRLPKPTAYFRKRGLKLLGGDVRTFKGLHFIGIARVYL